MKFVAFILGGKAVSGTREEEFPAAGLGAERVGRGGEGESCNQTKEVGG